MEGKTRGRQKIEMKKISNGSNLLVTFSKRRASLFKKTNELSTLCGVELAIIVFSPAEKVYCFGHPCVSTLINRYLNNNPHLPNTIAATSRLSQLVEACHKGKVDKLNKELMELNEQIEVKKKRREELEKMKKARDENGWWWEKPVEELSLQELEKLKVAMEELKLNVAKQAETESILAAAGNFVGGSSSAVGHFGDSSAASSSTNPHAF